MDEIRTMEGDAEPPADEAGVDADGAPGGIDERDAKIVALEEAMARAVVELDLDLPDAA